jgi:hypothetical protein
MSETAATYTTRAKELAQAHWEYIRGILEAHLHGEGTIKMAGYHYLTSFEHGYKHALEDVEAGMYAEGGLGGK